MKAHLQGAAHPGPDIHPRGGGSLKNSRRAVLLTALKIFVCPRGHNSAAALSEAEKINMLTEAPTTQSRCQHQPRAHRSLSIVSTCRVTFMAQELLVIKWFTLLSRPAQTRKDQIYTLHNTTGGQTKTPGPHVAR